MTGKKYFNFLSQSIIQTFQHKSVHVQSTQVSGYNKLIGVQQRSLVSLLSSNAALKMPFLKLTPCPFEDGQNNERVTKHGGGHGNSVFHLGWENGGCIRNWAQFSVQTTKHRAQFRARTTNYAWTPKIWAQSSARERN